MFFHRLVIKRMFIFSLQNPIRLPLGCWCIYPTHIQTQKEDCVETTLCMKQCFDRRAVNYFHSKSFLEIERWPLWRWEFQWEKYQFWNFSHCNSHQDLWELWSMRIFFLVPTSKNFEILMRIPVSIWNQALINTFWIYVIFPGHLYLHTRTWAV